MHHFWAQNRPFATNKFFWKKIFTSFLSTYWLLSLCKIWKKFFKQIQTYDSVPCWGPKWPICPNKNFFIKDLLISLVPFINVYLHAKNQSEILSINEILTIKEYWDLIGQEPFLAITWEPDFSQASSFCRMLMSHKNFHFTQIPDKTNDVIFFKKSKNPVFGHCWPFLVIFPDGYFFQKIWLSHKTICGPPTPS